MSQDSISNQVCKSCEIDKPKSEFSVLKSTSKINKTCIECVRTYGRNYYAANAEKCRKHKADSRGRDPEREKVVKLRYRQNNRQELREISRQWRKDNPELVKFMNKRWRDENRGEYHLHCLNKQNRLSGAKGYSYTNAYHIDQRFALFGGKCYLCGGEANTIDHVKPISCGGSNWPANLRPACVSCNAKKHAKDIKDFALEHGLDVNKYLGCGDKISLIPKKRAKRTYKYKKRGSPTIHSRVQP